MSAKCAKSTRTGLPGPVLVPYSPNAEWGEAIVTPHPCVVKTIMKNLDSLTHLPLDGGCRIYVQVFDLGA